MPQEIALSVIASVRFVTNKLEDSDLSALYLAVVADFDLTRVVGYEKIKPLLTEANGTKMHSETRRALDGIVAQRLG